MIEETINDHESPKFTVLIPTFYRRGTLIPALESAIAQTHQPHEVIVLDLASNEETLSELKEIDCKIPLRYIPFTGPFALTPVSRNYTFAMAEGNYIAYLDDDDLWETNYLETIATSVEDSRAHIIVSGFQEFNEDGNVGSPQFPPKDFKFDHVSARNPGYVMSNMVLHRKMLLASGGSDPFLNGSSDKGLVISMMDSGSKYTLIERALVKRRVGQRLQWSGGRRGNNKRVLPDVLRFTFRYFKRMTFAQKLKSLRKIFLMSLGAAFGR